MLISTKGQYALRLMVYMAQASDGSDTVPLRRVAGAEGLSLKYLEQLAHSMVEAGYLQSVRGRDGGYKLAVDPEKLTAGDILRAAEGDTQPVACGGLEGECPRETLCSVVDFWVGLDDAIDAYVDSVTLAQLADDGSGPGLRPFQTLSMHSG
ncbi:MAG: RrF2 family transcriptional regulator [Coriobacteriales bacterium]|jgi:Rrf2 family protein